MSPTYKPIKSVFSYILSAIAELRQDFQLSRLTGLKTKSYISLTFARFPS